MLPVQSAMFWLFRPDWLSRYLVSGLYGLPWSMFRYVLSPAQSAMFWLFRPDWRSRLYNSHVCTLGYLLASGVGDQRGGILSGISHSFI
jgi:hypothetical protein